MQLLSDGECCCAAIVQVVDIKLVLVVISTCRVMVTSGASWHGLRFAASRDGLFCVLVWVLNLVGHRLPSKFA